MKAKTANIGIAIALALIVSYVEMLIPFNFGIPGIKLGLTNVVIIIMLYLFGWKSAFLVSVSRIFLAGFLFGNMSMILYSLAGGVLSLTVMSIMKKFKGFSVIGISILGGITHNIGQIIIAILVVENLKMIYYLPVLLISGLITGMLIGIVAKEIISRLFKLHL